MAAGSVTDHLYGLVDTAPGMATGALSTLAQEAARRGDWPEAVRLWLRVRASAPDSTSAYLGGAAALGAAGRQDEAEQLLAEAAERFPAHQQIATARAWLANHRRAWPEALNLWAAIRAKWPESAVGYHGGGYALRACGHLEEARALLDHGHARFPGNTDIALLRAWIANSDRDWPTALPLWAEVVANRPDDPAACAGAANAQREAGRLDEAAATLAGAETRFPNHEPLAFARAWLADARGDRQAALALWEGVGERFSHNPRTYLGAVRAARLAGLTDRAEALLAKAAASVALLKPDAATAQLEFEIALARRDWPSVRRSAERIIAGGGAQSPQVYLALAQAHWHLHDPDAADQSARQTLDLDPKLADAVLVRAWVAAYRGDGTAAIQCYRALADLQPKTLRWQLKLVQLLNWEGRVKEAVAALELLIRQWPNDRMVRVFQRNFGPAATLSLGDLDEDDGAAGNMPAHQNEHELAILGQRAPLPGTRRRPLIQVDPSCEMQVAAVAGAETALLVFTGSNDALSMPLPLFDSYISPLDLTVIYLKDLSRLRYLRGIGTVGGDYPGTISVLREVLARIGARRICTFGNCAGGFGALRYGIELNAARIITFGAPTHSPHETPEKFEQARNFSRTRLTTRVPAGMSDLRPFLQQHSYHTQIDMFYDADDPRDTLHATHLADQSGVTLHPRRGQNMSNLFRRIILTEPDFWDKLAGMILPNSPVLSDV